MTKSTTLDDLEGPLRTVFQNTCVFRRCRSIFAAVLKIYVNYP